MKKMTRIGSFLLALVLAISLLPAVPVYAAGYGLYVCWVQVTDANCKDILGDGVFSYNPSTKTLTVSGDCETTKNIINTGNYADTVDGLTIYVAKDSRLHSTYENPFYFRDVVTITGPGKLTVTSPCDHMQAIYLVGTAKLTVKDTDLEAYGGPGIYGSQERSALVEFINSNVYMTAPLGEA